MNRRELIARLSLIVGGTVIGADAFLSGCKPAASADARSFSPERLAFLDEVGETVIPATASSPGAAAAGIGRFMQTIVTDCYTEKDQSAFMHCFDEIDQAAKKKFGKDFIALDKASKKALLQQIDADANAYEKGKKPDDPHHYFALLKQLTIWGFFSSKTGATQTLRYVAVPGRYDGCVPYKKGDKAWAT